MPYGAHTLHREKGRGTQHMSPVIVMLTLLPALSAAAPAVRSSALVVDPSVQLGAPPELCIGRQCPNRRACCDKIN